ncbi:MAG: cache domain-containing protein [Thermodesulfobacteriota bacterium]|nr:cache domain-containing protein [Thermodesulfobacteriota bacterium]
MWKNRSSIQAKFLGNMIFIAFLSIVLWSLIWIQGEYSTFKIESEAIRVEHFESQQKMLKTEVTDLVKYIRNMRAQAEQELKLTIKERVYQAHQIALNIYQQNIESKSHDEIKKMIKDALRPVRFDGGRCYYFAVSMDGIEVLYPVNPELEGKNLIDLQDSKGRFVIQNEIKIIKESGEGFVRSYWIKPDKNPGVQFPQITFIKHFKPLNWYFGTGDYLDDFEKQIKKELLNSVVTLRFGREGYFFGSTFKGEPLFSNGKITRGTGSVWDLTDPNGVKIIQEQRKTVENPQGGFIHYSWNKLNRSTPSPKVSFVQGIPGWEWMIGGGVYLDTIEKTISKNRAALTIGIKKKVVRSILILAVIMCLIYLWSRRISNQIQKSIKTFSLFLKKASVDSITINPNDIQLKEFREIAVLTNKMLKDRKQAEKALQESENRLNTLMNATADVVFLAEPDGTFLAVNNALAESLRMEKEELVGRKMSEFVSKETAEKREAVLEKILDDKKSFHGEYEHAGKYFEYSVYPIFDDNGNIKQAGVFSRDITHEIRMEEKLRQVQKMEAIGTLAGGIAHDFNNILFPVIGYTEMLLNDVSEESHFHTSLTHIYTAAMRATELVKQILTFSRQEKSELKLMKIQYVVKEVLKLIRSTIPATIEIKQNIYADCGAVKADPTQIHQIIMNLMTNAYHAMEETGGEMTITLREIQVDGYDLVTPDMEPGSYVCLTVTDTGIGMDKVIIEKIFDPFFTTKEQGKGTGMGLSTVHGIVKSMGGVVQVYSEPGKGSNFHVYFPVEKSSFKELKTRNKEIIQGGAEKILLVDDEEAIVTMEREMLEQLGYQVTSRTSSIEALKAFRAKPDKFDLVITDMAMPNMPGDKLAVELTRIRPDIPILLCTGFSETMSEEKAASLGIKGFLFKPIVMKDLAQKIREVLDEN